MDNYYGKFVFNATWSKGKPWECKIKGFIGFYHVEPENDGCRVTMQQTKTALPFFMRIIMVFTRGIIKKSMKGDLQRLKAIMEKQDN